MGISVTIASVLVAAVTLLYVFMLLGVVDVGVMDRAEAKQDHDIQWPSSEIVHRDDSDHDGDHDGDHDSDDESDLEQTEQSSGEAPRRDIGFFLPHHSEVRLGDPFGFEQGSPDRLRLFETAESSNQTAMYRTTLIGALPEDEVSKTHCWRPAAGELLCIPKAFVAGFPKCGTSNVYHMLLKHPQTRSRFKEPHAMRGNQSLEQYADVYRAVSSDVQQHLEGYHDDVAIDGSATTLWFWDSSSPTPYTISQYAPNASILAMVREPIARLWSDYRYFGTPPLSAELFHNRVVSSLKVVAQCMKNEMSSHPCVCMTELHNSYYMTARINIGAYSCHLRAWRAAAPGMNVKIVDVEQMLDEKLNATMSSILDFFQLSRQEPIESSPWWPEMRSVVESNSANVGTKGVGLTMLPETESLLQQFYEPFNTDFELNFGVSFGDYHLFP